MASRAEMLDKNALPKPCSFHHSFNQPIEQPINQSTHLALVCALDEPGNVNHIQTRGNSAAKQENQTKQSEQNGRWRTLLVSSARTASRTARRAPQRGSRWGLWYLEDAYSVVPLIDHAICEPLVQKGKFSAGTALFVSTLKKVDFLGTTS